MAEGRKLADGVPDGFEPEKKEHFIKRWKLPFPEEELEVYIMCAHPIGVAWERIRTWLEAENLKPAVSMIDLVDCLWTHRYCDRMGRYTIMRSNTKTSKAVHLPDDMPQHLDQDIATLFD